MDNKLIEKLLRSKEDDFFVGHAFFCRKFAEEIRKYPAGRAYHPHYQYIMSGKIVGDLLNTYSFPYTLGFKEEDLKHE